MADHEDKFVGKAEELTYPVCNKCAHYLWDGTCKAFPDGIPRPILTGKNKHKKPIDGDNGIQFEPIEE